jgi:hypothetical protein
MLWIALAAQLIAPVSIDLQKSLGPNDCPPWLSPGLWEVGIRVVVDKDGRPDNCETDFSDGNQQLGEYTCRLVIKRAKFEPARSQDGSTSYGVYRNSVFWTKTRLYQRPRPLADLKVTVDHMPNGLRRPYIIDAAVAVEADGKVSGCNPDPREPTVAQSLFPLVCEQLIHNYEAKPAALKGNPVRSIQVAHVRFDTK